MSIDNLQAGLRHTNSLKVDDRLIVPAVAAAFTGFSDMPPVFATAFLVGFVEWTCIEAVRPYLASNQRTVGMHVDLSHSAATPVGMTVSAEVELIAVKGRKLRFSITCRDEVDVISKGYHERYIIDADRFMARLKDKSTAQSG